jgi:CheY-like chemotaxis protein
MWPDPVGASERSWGFLPRVRMPTVRALVAPSARILLVEDDPALRSALAEILRENGYEVACAADGKDALAQLDARPIPAMILLDLAMPVMDGWAFRAEQRRDPRFAEIPTVVLSASLSGGDARLEALEPAAALAKPFDLDRLIETVQRLCAVPA